MWSELERMPAVDNAALRRFNADVWGPVKGDSKAKRAGCLRKELFGKLVSREDQDFLTHLQRFPAVIKEAIETNNCLELGVSEKGVGVHGGVSGSRRFTARISRLAERRRAHDSVDFVSCSV